MFSSQVLTNFFFVNSKRIYLDIITHYLKLWIQEWPPIIYCQKYLVASMSPTCKFYKLKRYQKAFTFFMTGGYMKFPNLIIRIALDLNEIYLFVKYQLSEIPSHLKFLKMHETRSDDIRSYLQ